MFHALHHAVNDPGYLHEYTVLKLNYKFKNILASSSVSRPLFYLLSIWISV